MIGWIFIFFCFFGLLFCSYGVLLHGATFFSEKIGEPFYERLSEGGRKNYWKFFLVALPICFIHKSFTRAPIWLVFYFVFTYGGIDKTTVYQILGFLIFASAISKVAEEGKYYFPVDKNSGKYFNQVVDSSYDVFFPKNRK